MPVDSARDDEARADKVRRIEAGLETLNVRIARLSAALGASLDSEADIQAMLERSAPFYRLHPQQDLAQTTSSEYRRLLREWEELRGLLALRCNFVAHTLNDVGLDATREIANLVEEQLQRHGFKPGVDGFALLRRMNVDDDK